MLLVLEVAPQLLSTGIAVVEPVDADMDLREERTIAMLQHYSLLQVETNMGLSSMEEPPSLSNLVVATGWVQAVVNAGKLKDLMAKP